MLPEESKQLLMEIPRSPPTVGRNLFVSEAFKKNSHPIGNIQEGADAFRAAMGDWKNLPDSVKEAYNQKASALWSEYEENLKAFLK